MAISHFSIRVACRKKGHNAVKNSAYRRGERYVCERSGETFSFKKKKDVIHSELSVPEDAPKWAYELSKNYESSAAAKLWNAVEFGEKRKDAQLCRDFEFALPRELGYEQHLDVIRDYVSENFTSQGMMADWSLHYSKEKKTGLLNPHVHIGVTMRALREPTFLEKMKEKIGLSEGLYFGDKVRSWNSKDLMRQWRDSYGVVVNKHLEKAGLDVRIDPRSYKDQGLDLIPQPKMGPKARDRIDRGKPCNKLEDLERVRKKNRSLLHKNPDLVLDTITRYQSTFTKRDIAKFLNRYIDDEKEFYQLRSQVEALPELIKISADAKKGEEVYTTHFMLELEISLVKTSGVLAQTHKCPPRLSGREWLITEASDKLKESGSSTGLSGDQVAAIHHMTNDGQLKVVVGYAGAGKTTCLETAKKVWASSGYRVVGAAPTGRAAENLEGSGIASETLHKWEQEWRKGREQLDKQSILVVDEAGMVDARRLHFLLKESEKTGFKVVLIGDPEQLSPIEAGCGLRTVMDKVGYCSISTVVRQYKDWQREATLKLATQKTVQALEAYDQKEHVHLTERPKEKLIQEFSRHLEDKDWDEKIGCLILTYTNKDVRELNTLARDEARKARRLQGDDHLITITKCRESEILGEEKDLLLKVTRETRFFAVGDQIVFLKNDYDLKVKNGQRGQIKGIEQDSLKIEAELGHKASKSVTVSLNRYGFIDHGYAMTIHKSQGVTEEAVLVYGTKGMDRSLTYVSMTRHRSTVDLYADSQEFEDKDRLFKALSRDTIKENVLDYALAQKELTLKEEAERREKRKKLEETPSQKMGAFMSKILDKGRTWFGGNEGEERGQGSDESIQVPSYQEESRSQKTKPLSAQGSSDRGSMIQESLTQEALKQNQRATKTSQSLGQAEKDLPKVDMAAMEASLKTSRSSPQVTLSEAGVSSLGALERQGGEEALGKGKEGLNKDQIKKGIPVYELEPDPYDDWSLSPLQKSPEVSGSRVSGRLSEEDRYRVTGGVAGRNPKTGETAAMEKKRREERGYTPLTEEQKYLVTSGIAGRNPKTGETAAAERKRSEELKALPLAERQKLIKASSVVVSKTSDLSISLPKQNPILENKKGRPRW